MAVPSASIPSVLELVYNHIVLPRKLPGRYDGRTARVEEGLASRMADACRIMERTQCKTQDLHQWERTRRVLQSCKGINAGGKVNRTALLDELRCLEKGFCLILHVVEQNAGLLVKRDNSLQDEHVVFEAFEASPQSESVLAAEDALLWKFPGSAVAIPFSTFSNASFQENLATFLEQASGESVKRFAARAKKAGSSAFECRDTGDPALITQLLMTLLEVNGHRVSPVLLQKRVRDDVLLADGAEKPWRRCPLWLVLRVGLHRYLTSIWGGDHGRMLYKMLLCLVHARLLEDSLHELGPELLFFLKAKLSRRLIKLQHDMNKLSSPLHTACSLVFEILEPVFLKATQETNRHVKKLWGDYKHSIKRPMKPPPKRAGHRDLYLRLPNSGEYLGRILAEPLSRNTASWSGESLQLLEKSDLPVKSNQADAFNSRYWKLAQMETTIEQDNLGATLSAVTNEKGCSEYADKITAYLKAVSNAYEENSEQKSLMLLTVMELWMIMDKHATDQFPFLGEFNPGFPTEILDVLQLSRFQDFERLHNLQIYLHNRHTRCGECRMTIFDDPTQGCYAERVYQTSQKLQSLHQKIDVAAATARTKKEEEWSEMSIEYENLMRKISEMSHILNTEYSAQTCTRNCPKCSLERVAARMNIRSHEHPLPTNRVLAQATIFELRCPRAFAAYRDSTWMIISTLGHRKSINGFEPKLLLSDYSELRQYIKSSSCALSLASNTKSFLMTHYSHLRFPVGLDDVLRPCGLKLGYYDSLSKAWTGRLQQRWPSFAHHCKLDDLCSALSSLLSSPAFSPDHDGPSSYEILASQTQCPSSMNVHEFMAIQALFSTRHRWMIILNELGSSNLNFSTETTYSIISYLALHAGPQAEKSPLRDAHMIFSDNNFCMRMIEQLERRLNDLATNWRESYCMGTLMSMILRLCTLVKDLSVLRLCEGLLMKARTITNGWIGHLRAEIQKAVDSQTSQTCSQYAVWAALLCRRSYSLYLSTNDDTNAYMDAEALRCFIECSIALQDYMGRDPAKLPLSLKNAFIRDTKMAYQLRSILRRSVEVQPESLRTAVKSVWPEPEGGPARSFSQSAFLSSPHDWWFRCLVSATNQSAQQTLHYNVLTGSLLIDRQPLGKLPAEYRESVVLKELFGNQSLLTVPSALHGMTHVVCMPIYGHQIHLGQRHGKTIVRACIRDSILELIPRGVFYSAKDFDLPAPLVRDCIHWLDLKTGILEIRKLPNIWHFKASNWCINFHTRRGTRRTVSLVDPQSRAFQDVASIFNQFEFPRELTVFQPSQRSLSVELRRLDLSFFVNEARHLESAQLRSIIDPNQDAGTWYGLNSKLCLCETKNPGKRSIIVPFGEMVTKRTPFHVTLHVLNSGNYARFYINDVLGRLECAMEPRLLYLKAQLHAFTSFPVPDPLTQRTGTEEALNILHSGQCQPWSPLKPLSYQSLTLIAGLTPKRHYYPRDLKMMQEVQWDSNLTATIQHDAFRALVEDITRKSEQLWQFATQKNELQPLLPAGVPAGDRQLLERSLIRNRRYERASSVLASHEAYKDSLYEARDQFKANQEYQNVYESVAFIRDWEQTVQTTNDLAGILQNFPVIGGHNHRFDKILLTDRLEVSLGAEWGSLVEFCRACDKEETFRVQFFFAVMAFRADIDMDLVRTLVSFAIFEDLKALDPPPWPSYFQFRRDQVPHLQYLIQLIQNCFVPFTDVLDDLKHHLSSKQRKQRAAAEMVHEQQVERDCKAFAQFLFYQWPCVNLCSNGCPESRMIDVPKAFEIIRPEWERLFHNIQLTAYLRLVQDTLNRHHSDKKILVPTIAVHNDQIYPTRITTRNPRLLLRDLLCKTGPPHVPGPAIVVRNDFNLKSAQAPHRNPPLLSHEIRELEGIIRSVQETDSGKLKSIVREQYALDLEQSLNALKRVRTIQPRRLPPTQPATAADSIEDARQKMEENFRGIRVALERDVLGARWYQEGGLWPCTTPVSLLEHLRSTLATKFGTHMKKSLVTYGVSITHLQRLMRMKEATIKRNSQGVMEEERNFGYANWDPSVYPEWLLLQIDANFLIRPSQVDVALATISPASGSNSVLQMNMGEGKTSCIMPMVAAVLANRKQLLRVIVPKPLLLQTAQLFQARLGGLIGRQTRHLPFSRKISTAYDDIKLFTDIHTEILKTSGVMLCLPEHILSFRLSGQQRLSDGRLVEAKHMIDVDTWLKRISRDVLDESDVTLAVRTQLIYPSGSQSLVDGSPQRWLTAQQLLALIPGHLRGLQEAFPGGVEVHTRPGGGFPVIYLLRREAEEGLITRLLEDIRCGRVSTLPIRDCVKSDWQVIRQFLSSPRVRIGITTRIEKMFPDRPAVRKVLYLLRGLLVHRILLLCLKKRWAVQYGLHPQRDPIAVPFHAKGVASETADFGHIDVAILFTCLAFYYDGINREQLRLSLNHLLRSDDPGSEYNRWTTSSLAKFPDSLREYTAINVDDEAQLAEIWQVVRYNVTVVDYFLNNFVFPKHAKQFRVKIQASGWDIPLISLESPSVGQGASRSGRSTGFSGTNDNKPLQPLDIQQADLPAHLHTNAEVLTRLLEPRNRDYIMASTLSGQRLTETGLLNKLKHQRIRILIDAGAQILEMDNLGLVKAWLGVDSEAVAAVYFDTENKPIVQYRHGHTIPLSASPFADDLTDCLVYLDQAHCRGTDLKLPLHARGALTLGVEVTKDSIVQAAMRLRQLATTQSLVFISPLEVHQSIRDLCKTEGSIDSSHVIRWLLEQTCRAIEQLQPLYYAQGVDFCHRMQAALDNPEFIAVEAQREAYLRTLRQKELQSVERCYEPKTHVKAIKDKTNFSEPLALYAKELSTQRKGFQDNGNAVHGSTLQEVEQEREVEVAHEVEAVREVQKPVYYEPLTFLGLHRDIESFVKTGRLAAGSAGYEPALEAMMHTALGLKHGIIAGPTVSRLYVSSEFRRTIQLTQGRPNDSFLRPVQWILWSTYRETAIAIIPEEVELVIPLLRDVLSNNHAPATHLLTYAAPTTKRMLHFNHLDYYSFPSMPKAWKAPVWLRIELGIFAGRLYFEYEEYEELLVYLGLQVIAGVLCAKHASSAAAPFGLDGLDQSREAPPQETDTLEEVPEAKKQQPPIMSLTFLQEWIAVRRKGQDFMHTPMGYLCQGKPLQEDHPFFTKATTSESGTAVEHRPRLGNDLANGHTDAHDETDDFAYEGDFFGDGNVLESERSEESTDDQEGGSEGSEEEDGVEEVEGEGGEGGEGMGGNG